MSKQPAKPSRPNSQNTPRPVVPNLPSTTGNKSGGDRANYPPAKSK